MRINSFSKTYSGRRVLNMPDVELEKGKIYAVIGANGSGKSTFAKIVAGIEKADDKKSPISGVNIGYMPQKNFAFRMTLKKNILLNGDNSEKADSIINALGLTRLSSAQAKKLSGGEMARMALARILMQKYDLLILDEPTAAMDMESIILSERIIYKYCQETECIVLLVTHSIAQAKRLASEILYFDSGELKEFGRTESLIESPNSSSFTQFLQFFGMSTATES